MRPLQFATGRHYRRRTAGRSRRLGGGPPLANTIAFGFECRQVQMTAQRLEQSAWSDSSSPPEHACGSACSGANKHPRTSATQTKVCGTSMHAHASLHPPIGPAGRQAPKCAEHESRAQTCCRQGTAPTIHAVHGKRRKQPSGDGFDPSKPRAAEGADSYWASSQGPHRPFPLSPLG